jgi:rfaE bifunctional protein kinase chain/domain/rfaE bifunctional protein nucleotidyltransferase chain/domain
MKFLDDQKLLNQLKKLRKQNKKIILCHGVFDLIHLGHIEHFKSAKNYGDYLIVSVTKDKFINKGPGRPLFSEQQRIEFLRNIKIIDKVILSKTESSIDVINFIKPDFYIKGPDYKDLSQDKTKKIILEKKAVKKNGGKIKFTNDITYSSSNIINNSNLILNYEQKLFINKLKKKFNFNQIEEILKKFKKLNILVVGELIIDKYCFGDVIGKSGKEPHLVLKENLTEYYLGGSAAIARHLSTFVKEVKLLSPFGGEKIFTKFVKEKFDSNITTFFLKPYSGFSTILKTRFVDKNSNYKLFGSYLLPNTINYLAENKIIQIIKKNKIKADMTLVCDYGHNFISKNIASEIVNKNNSLFLNAQINASNRGFQNINKYRNVNSIILNENELRQELRDDVSNIVILAKKLIKNKKIQNLIITRGAKGAILVNHTHKVYSCPGFAKKTLDKVGAGDAMLALASLGLKLKLDPELVLFISSLAAAISVQSIGNKENITYNKLNRIIEYILK